MLRTSKNISFGYVFLALLISGCDDEVPNGGDDPSLSVSADRTSNLMPGETITLTIDVMNFTLDESAIGGDPVDGVGHYHIYWDGELVEPAATAEYSFDVPADAVAGDHELRVGLAENDHTELGVESSITISIDDGSPTVSVSADRTSNLMPGETVTLTIDVMNFTLDESAIGGDPVDGFGHYHIYWDGELVAPAATVEYSFDIPAEATGGDHELSAGLAENDHTELGVESSLSISIDDVSPSVSVTADRTDDLDPGETITLTIDVMNFTLDESAIGGDPVDGVGHYHIYWDDELVAPAASAEYSFDIPGDATGGDHELRVGLAANDHSELGVESSITISIDDGAPNVSVTAARTSDLMPGETITLTIDVMNFTLDESSIGGEPVDGVGHYHIYWDGELIAPAATVEYNFDIPGDATGGDHELRVGLAANDHSELGVESSVTISIDENAPAINVAADRTSDLMPGETITLTIDVMNFILDESSIGGDPVDGVGHYHIYWDGELVAPAATVEYSFDIPGDATGGDHELRVGLAANDHSELGVESSIAIAIDENTPAVNVTADRTSDVMPGETITLAIDVMNFTLDESAIGGDPIDGVGHYHIYWDGELIAPAATAEYSFDIPGDAEAGDYELRINLAANDHSELGMYGVVEVTVVEP